MFVPDILGAIVWWVKISLKCACGQEEVVQLGDVSNIILSNINDNGENYEKQKI